VGREPLRLCSTKASISSKRRSLRLFVLRAVLPRRAEIGAYFTEVVDSWDAASLVSRLELQVGKDL
jgi:uncharacterized membrane-anchored protein YjiN (DUF445 family)